MTVVQTFERMDHQRLTNERMLVLAVVLGGGGFWCGADLPERRPRGGGGGEVARCPLSRQVHRRPVSHLLGLRQMDGAVSVLQSGVITQVGTDPPERCPLAGTMLGDLHWLFYYSRSFLLLFVYSFSPFPLPVIIFLFFSGKCFKHLIKTLISIRIPSICFPLIFMQIVFPCWFLAAPALVVCLYECVSA